MPQYEAEVKPNQPWTQDGTADVTPKPPFPDTSTFNLPLEHRGASSHTVDRSTYPEGLVIIPSNGRLVAEVAVLPMEVSSGNVIEISDGEHQDWPEGIVTRFID